MDWREYQEKTAEFFRSLGLNAETNVTIQGARTEHDIDVMVKFSHVGFEVQWIIECKHWNSKVSKLHVLALREIVSDTGADRGILLAENGFQSGAIEAANLTNVQVTSLANVMDSAKSAINQMRLRDLYERLMWCKHEYWEIPKSMRIESGLRFDYEVGYTGRMVIEIGEALIGLGFLGNYPVKTDELHQQVAPTLIEQELPAEIQFEDELINFLDVLVTIFEGKISKCKAMFGLKADLRIL